MHSKTSAALTALAAFALPALALEPGDEVTVDSIAKAEFIQGSAPEAWAEGELYVIECWATWCGPCIAAIPHVDELYDKYHEKGLNVIGMNVWEDGKEAVAEFVSGKGDGMSYPVAYVGRGGEFEETWLKAAGVRGIPHAFLVKDGKFLFSTHPARLDEETINGLLAGGEVEKKIVTEIMEAEALKTHTQAQFQAFMQAAEAKDVAGMEAAAAEIEKLDPDFQFLERLKLDIAVVKQDWDGAKEILTAMEDEREAMISAATILQAIDTSAEAPSSALLEEMAKALSAPAASDPALKAALARVQWKLGRKEEAMATAKAVAADPGRFPKAPFEAFAASFDTDDPQTLTELFQAVQDAQ